MANNPERDCSTCKNGDNGSVPEGCLETCLESDLSDYELKTIPPNHPLVKRLQRRIEELELDNDRLLNICSLAEQRLRFSIDAFNLPPRPPFRGLPVTKDKGDNNDKDTPNINER